jgi:MFS transporter, ACS family, tartrate transporter
VPATSSLDATLEQQTLRRASLRLFPFLFVLYIFNFLDRTNVAFAALQMNQELKFSSSAFGVGAGIFFLGYSLFETPSNYILARVGARRWIARIMITWGVIACAMMSVRTSTQFYVLRFALGVAEAGFFPGIIYYLSLWFPAEYRATVTSRFLIAIPLSGAVGGPLAGALLGLGGKFQLSGWQWLFLTEGFPSVLLGFAVLAYLPDGPEEVRWLSEEHRTWLSKRLDLDRAHSVVAAGTSAWRALTHPAVWLVAAPYFLTCAVGYTYIFWAPTLVRDTLNSNDVTTGLVVGALAAVSALAMLVVGASSDRKGERCLHASFCIALTGFGFLGCAVVSGPFARILALALVQVGFIAFLSPFWCLPTQIFTGTAAAVSIALVNSIGNVGGFLGPSLISRLEAAGGKSLAFVVFGTLALVASAACAALKRAAAFRNSQPTRSRWTPPPTASTSREEQ